MKIPVGIAEAFSRYRPVIDDWEAFTHALERPLPRCVWTNTLRISPGELDERFRRDGLAVARLPWKPDAFRFAEELRPGKMWRLLAGLYHIQEEVSMLPVELLEPEPGERILDLCAAPGNKSAQIAVRLENRGTLVANDLKIGRMAAIRNAIERLGLLNVSTTHYDGTCYPREAGLFDRILVDGPCSCEGISRKNPRVANELDAGGFRINVETQRLLLKRAVRLCRPGGRIVYSTCTYAPEENEANVDWLLGEFPDILTLRPAVLEAWRSAPGLTEWLGQSFDPRVAECMRVWPHLNDTGGFFVAVFEKLAEERRRDPVRQDHHPELTFAQIVPEVESLAPVASRAEDEELDRGLTYLEEQFGFTPELFAGLRIYRGRKDGYYLLAPDHRPPPQPTPDASGNFFLKVTLRYPKLSTSAAILLGPHATRNYIDLDAEGMRAYYERKIFAVEGEAARAMEGRGYAILRHEGAALGLGFYRPATADEPATLESWFPRGWGWGFAPL